MVDMQAGIVKHNDAFTAWDSEVLLLPLSYTLKMYHTCTPSKTMPHAYIRHTENAQAGKNDWVRDAHARRALTESRRNPSHIDQSRPIAQNSVAGINPELAED